MGKLRGLCKKIVPVASRKAATVVREAKHWHTYQVLTKRADRLEQLLTTKLRAAAAARHIWWGVSVEDKKYGIPRIAHLQRAPATVRFLSVEPLLEDLGPLDLRGIHWVIVGGESGPGARPMNPCWVTAIKHQCDKHDALFFFKQWGGVRKARNGRLFNGRTYDNMPNSHAGQPPARTAREALARDVARLTGGWDDTPLVQVRARHSSVA